ncbi:sensor domain-containing diguanylate cyclase [Thalassolituus sp.]|jgi:diguanylate cyclase (GGDEF)-like protein|uniref:GGDEF domain-containing protein n=1 Tax=Thalassolituus sp. TaxID=2030822 RepID=UPI002A83BBCD|nr:sensor domain-containing diguanylate cyclase [Thalassolituus sp.]
MSETHIEIGDIHWLMDILQNIDVGLVVLDREYNIHVWNGFMESHSAISPQKAKGQNLFKLFEEIPEAWFRQKSEPVFQLKTRTFTIWEQRPYLFRFKNSRPITGRTALMFQNTSIIPLESLDRQVNHICVIIYDVTDIAVSRADVKNANKTLTDIQSKDPLTGLWNRAGWEPQLVQQFNECQAAGNECSLVTFDLDNFRTYNGHYGHQQGDQVLSNIGKLLEKAVGLRLSARLGGEVFGLLLPGQNGEQAKAMAEKLRRAVLLLNSGNADDNIPKITASFGVASLAKDTHSAHEWLQCADKALYHAKESGRNQTTLYQHRPN